MSAFTHPVWAWIVLVAVVTLGGASNAQSKSVPAFRRSPVIRPATIDVATGTVTRGARGLTPSCSTVSGFSNLDFGSTVDIGVDIGGGQVEWFCAGVKNSDTPTDMVVGIEFAYCSARLDPHSGGVGGSILLGFYEGYQAGGVSPGTCVAAITLMGLPANTADSTLNGPIPPLGCYILTLGNTSFPLDNFIFADGPIAYSWRSLDFGTDGVLAGTAPILACVGEVDPDLSCIGGADALGMTNSIDRFAPPGSYESTFSVPAPFKSSMNINILEAPERNRWYVDDSAGSTELTGGDWFCAFHDLQDALTVAGVGDEIWVAEGSYTPDSSTDRSRSFELKTGVALYGGFAGFETLLTQRNPAANPTILTGDLLGNDTGSFGNYDDNSLHVVTGGGVNASAILDGFIVRGGSAMGNADSGSGGGLFIQAGSPSIANCTIEKNQAKIGGGVHARGAPSFSLCRIRDNRAFVACGGLDLLNGSASLVNCTIERNSANQAGGLRSMSLRMESCVVQANAASYFGGGLIDYGRSIVRNTQFVNNTASSGGGAYGLGGGTQLSDCTFINNRASSSGGGARLTGQMTVLGCKFEGNTGYAGGGIDVYSPFNRIASCRFIGNKAALGGAGSLVSSELINCVATKNIASYGAGFYVASGLPSLVNCSIAGNSGTWGGGIYSRGTTGLRNSIIWNLTNQELSGNYNAFFNQVRGGYSGLMNSAIDPAFTNLRAGDLHLRPTSPCIDTGVSSFVPSWAWFDADKRHRFFDAPPVNNPTLVDRGAFEFGAPLGCTADCDGDGICDSVEISSGSDTDLNGNSIPDLCDGKDAEPSAPQNVPITLLPAGGAGNPLQEPVVEFTNLAQPGGAEVTTVQSLLDLHPGENTYRALGTAVTVETTLADGGFFLRVRVPFTFLELSGVHWSSVDLLYFDTGAQHWEIAPTGNTVPSPGHPGPLGDRFVASGTSLPTLSTDLGDYGVFYDPAAARGFAWANVDHTTDFSAGVLLGLMPDCDEDGLDDRAEIEGGAADCNQNGLLDACELAAAFELDCDGNLVPDSCDIFDGTQTDCNGNGIPDQCDVATGTEADCDGNLIPDLCDILEGRQSDCNGNGIPDACDIASGSSLDVEPSGGDGIPDECALRLKAVHR